jgi:hypothetical protein
LTILTTFLPDNIGGRGLGRRAGTAPWIPGSGRLTLVACTAGGRNGKLPLHKRRVFRSITMKTITIKTGGMYGEATIPIDRISAVGTMDKIQRSEVSPTGFLIVDGEKFFISAEDVIRVKAAMQ